jgi:hypothetical protein
VARDIVQVGARLFRIHADALSEKLVIFSISEYTLFSNAVNLAGIYTAHGHRLRLFTLGKTQFVTVCSITNYGSQ